ncbi:MAG: tandem-type lipoprotein [Staphylococcus epidermidis]|nr:tandem-type lipoprotein [Staphylococcus epidermidis]
MKHSKKLLLCISFLLITFFIGGCGSMTKEGNKETQIKKSFEKTLSMYPIKNLEDLYDKEGYRDEEFDKDDKGTRGMVLKINRNTQTSKGDYITNKITYDNKGRPQSNKKKYPVKMKNNEIIPIKKIEDSKIKREIGEFKFFAQYADFKELKDYKNGNISYNPNVPSYSAEYDLENSDYNVKQLRERYDIPTKQAPKLLLKGTGDLKGSSIGTKDVEFTFTEGKQENIYFSDSMNFMPSEDD